MAEVHLDHGHIQRARTVLSQLPPAADASLRAWLALAQIFTEQGDTASAVIAYKNASLLSPFDPEPVATLSRLLTQQDDHAEAAKWARRAQLNGELWQILSHAKPLEPQGPALETVMQMGRILSELRQHRAAGICFGSLTDHFKFGAEARRAIKGFNQHAPAQRSLLVAGLQDLDRSVSLAGAARIALEQPAEIEGTLSTEGPPPVALVDIATEIGLEFTYFQSDGQQDSLAETLGGGIGVIDFDVDGWPDLFLSQSNSLPGDPGRRLSDCLFRSFRGAAAVDVTFVAGVAHYGYGHGCAVSDIDNDGFPDLYVCKRGENIIYRNNGDGTFRDVTEEAGLTGVQWSTSASFADYDRDGDLDLYNTNYVRIPNGRLGLCRNGNYHGPCRVMDFPAEQDVFQLNEGDGSFRDRTDVAGLVAAAGKGLGVISSDVNNDGWIDLFVGNDTTGNFLFRNLGEDVTRTERSAWRGFNETGVLVGVAFNRDGKGEACMGIASEDLNHDGLFDLFISNYEDETNTFYANLGRLGFEDRTHCVGLATASRPMLGWGMQFVDLNGDRDRDLFVANGHLYDVPMRSQLFLNKSGKFIDASYGAGPFFQTKRFGRSVAVVDWNNDLAADLAVSFLHSPFALLANRNPIGNRLAIRLVGTQSPRQAHGAQLSITAGGRMTCFQNSSDGGFMAASENDVKIGLGPHKSVDTLQVRWPSGAVQVWNRLAAGRKYALVEGRPTPCVLQSIEVGGRVRDRTGEAN